MNNLDHLRDMLCDELDELNRKDELNAGDLETAHKLTDTIKNIDKIEALECGEYSRAGEWEADMRGTFGDHNHKSYRNGNSYTNAGRHYVRGHYSRDGEKDRLISSIENAMHEATGAEREAYKRAIDELRRV